MNSSHHESLARGLLAALQAQDFAATPDPWSGGKPLGVMPSIDLAVARFAPGKAPVWANVLLSREHPQGLIATIAPGAGAVLDLRFDADQRDAQLDSIAWMPDADWSALRWRPVVPNEGATHRVVATYPASLVKLMVAVGVGMAVERGLCDWPAALEPMIVVSDNDATDVCVALLHRVGMMDKLNARFAELGLRTLQMNNTTVRGGWRNAQGAGVGQLHMTAWDTVRLLWLLDSEAPPPPWLPAGTALLQRPACERLHGLLARQAKNDVLSAGSLREMPGWVDGLPDAPAFAHKTGTTNSYASDAGIVRTPEAHYLVAAITSLGRRFAMHADAATTTRVQLLGAAVHKLVLTLDDAAA